MARTTTPSWQSWQCQTRYSNIVVERHLKVEIGRRGRRFADPELFKIPGRCLFALWVVYPINRIIFQPNATRRYPIFHPFKGGFSTGIVPSISAGG